LAELLYERNSEKQSIIDLFSVIDRPMRLQDELEQRLQEEVSALLASS
jgi:chromosome condensin MukBEF complex kleisin-like MukF subunit